MAGGLFQNGGESKITWTPPEESVTIKKRPGLKGERIII